MIIINLVGLSISCMILNEPVNAIPAAHTVESAV